MISFNNLVIIIAAISAAISGSKDIKWYSNQVLLLFSIVSFITEIIIHILFAYKFPLLFVSYIIITDPLFQYIIKYCYKNYRLFE